MHRVVCPQCGQERTVAARKPWMTGEPPYSKTCKPCSHTGKVHSQATKDKISKIVSEAQTEEVLQRKSAFMKAHPELWKGRIATGAGGGWNKGKITVPRSKNPETEGNSDDN